MDFEKVKYVYFLGIGGIGMSAIARYFAFKGKQVSGYDRTRTDLTAILESEGIAVHYEDDITLADKNVIDDKDASLIVYTPAIPAGHAELNYFNNNDYVVYKRSQVLGMLSKNSCTIAVAGTHGKTSVTTMTTHLLQQRETGCSSFMGGISKNYNTNFLYSDKSDLLVVEADEYDRSFHHLYPATAVITSMDSDHLDIYGSHDKVRRSFYEFTDRICKNGYLLCKKGLDMSPVKETLQARNITINTYSLNDRDADFYVKNITAVDGFYTYDIVTPSGVIEKVQPGISGLVNVENSIAATALALQAGLDFVSVKKGLQLFLGVKRRFDYQLRTDTLVYIDDYAHHPEELKAFISSVKALYKNKKVSGIFQPHLYSRTRDFADGFAEALSLLDELYLLDIYPAREEPIPGVNSEMIFNKVEIKDKYLTGLQTVVDDIMKTDKDIILTMGAGNIDTLVPVIKEELMRKYESV